MQTVLLLLGSNLFMTFAWYWHFRAKADAMPLIGFILISWLIALPEYCLAVRANRIGLDTYGGPFTVHQLKVLQEGLSLLVFLGFALAYLKTPPHWKDLAGMGLIFAGLCVALWPRSP